ncbi:MAG: sugar ABC transporter permease [Spirochaetaceae bacterium]
MISNKRDLLIDIIFILPVSILFFIFTIYPFLGSFYYSLTQWNGFTEPVFIGIANFKRLFDEGSFLISLRNTILFALSGLCISNVISLCLALALKSAGKMSSVLRTIFYLPGVVSFVSMSIIWSSIYHYNGALNQLLRKFGLEVLTKEWLGTYQSVIPSLIVILVWSGMGFGLIIFIAGLNSIPKELYEAADVDGASPITKFRIITFPLLMPSITIVTFLGFVTTLKIFDLPFIMTGGGPGDASNTVAMIIYKQAFSYNNYGYASAAGIILFILVGIVSVVQMRLTRSKEVQM